VFGMIWTSMAQTILYTHNVYYVKYDYGPG